MATTTTPIRKSFAVSPESLLRAYRTMVLARRLDDKEIQLKRQNRAFFQISGAGHEATGVAAGLCLKPGYDWFFLYYRDRALCLELGVTAYDMLLASVGSGDDPSSGGRQMPSHWTIPALHIASVSSAVGTQILQATGGADASLYFSRVRDAAELTRGYHADEIVLVTLGDGATSEGEFWESLNWSSNAKLPLLYLV
ncbi:MAG: thiamine pyrophosphate-dependent enzyme, partial [Terriglobia bacterium]